MSADAIGYRVPRPDAVGRLRASTIRGLGVAVPSDRVTNHELAVRFGVTPDWIASRTGIEERTRADPSDTTSGLATRAGAQALENAGVHPDEIDLIVVGTATPDHPMPAVACQVQAALGCTHAFAFDVNAACVGFLTGFMVATRFLETGKNGTVLVIGADLMSRITDDEDRSTSILFADAAGAAVLRKGDGSEPMPFAMHADGTRVDDLFVPGGGTALPAAPAKMVMNGRSVFHSAVRGMAGAIREVVAQVGLYPDDLDWLVLHQANQRILNAVATDLGVPPERFVSVVRHHGNSGAATIPVAMHAATRDGRIQRGDVVAFAAAGAGFTWGATAFRY